MRGWGRRMLVAVVVALLAAPAWPQPAPADDQPKPGTVSAFSNSATWLAGRIDFVGFHINICAHRDLHGNVRVIASGGPDKLGIEEATTTVEAAEFRISTDSEGRRYLNLGVSILTGTLGLTLYTARNGDVENPAAGYGYSVSARERYALDRWTQGSSRAVLAVTGRAYYGTLALEWGTDGTGACYVTPL